MFEKSLFSLAAVTILASCGGSGNSLNDTPDVSVTANQIAADTTPTSVGSLSELGSATLTEGEGIVVESDGTDILAIANGTTVTMLEENAYEDQNLYLVDLVSMGEPAGTMLVISDDIGAFLQEDANFDADTFDFDTVLSGYDIGTLGYQINVSDYVDANATKTLYTTDFSISKPNQDEVLSVSQDAYVTSTGDVTSSGLSVSKREPGFTAPTGTQVEYSGLMNLEYTPEGAADKSYLGEANMIVNFDTFSGTLSAENLLDQTETASVTGSFDVSETNGAMIGTSSTMMGDTTIQGGLLGNLSANGDVAGGIVGSSENSLFGIFGVSQ